MVAKFDAEAFVEACARLLLEQDPLTAIAELVERAIREPTALERAFPVPVDPDDDGILSRSPELLVANAFFPGGFATGVHDHMVPAVIGVWAGYEDNHMYERTNRGLAKRDVVRLVPGEVLALDETAIHEVHAPSRGWSGALHVYLGDLLGEDRHSWPSPDQPPRPFDGETFEIEWQQAAEREGLVRQPGHIAPSGQTAQSS